MKRFLLVANSSKKEAVRLAQSARTWLEGKAEVLGLDLDPSASLRDCVADIVVVFGGDGTVLNVVRRLGAACPLLLTVNLGHLGFLAEVSPQELEPMLDRILAGHYRVSDRHQLQVRILQDGKEQYAGHVLNEIVIRSATAVRMARLALEVDGHELTEYAGDGLIVSSPTGSTAYALSAGGPIMNPELRAMVAVPLCPHHLGNRPVVFGEDEVLSVRASRPHEELVFICDGQEQVTLPADAKLEIRITGRAMRLILGKSLGRYDILRAKFGWGNKNE